MLVALLLCRSAALSMCTIQLINSFRLQMIENETEFVVYCCAVYYIYYVAYAVSHFDYSLVVIWSFWFFL